MRQWRLINDQPTRGRQNMAVDEAILWAVSRGDSPPTLRLYAWSPPCLSLGYAQKSSDVDFKRLSSLGWDIVRRPTGGRAILHTDELTYSVALPATDDLADGGVIESYRRLSQALVAGLQRLGVMVQADQRAKQGITGPVCFETPSHYEITVNGRKLVGSAQVRRQNGILQHGSLPLFGDLARICDVLVYPDDVSRQQAKAQVRGRAITLVEAMNSVLSSQTEPNDQATAVINWQVVAAALVAGFAQTFAIDFGGVPGELSSAEREYAERVASEVYAHVEWSRRQIPS